MDDTRKIGLKEAIEVIRDLLREYLKRTGKLPETIVAVGGTALAILRIRERSDDLDLYLSEVDDGAVDATVNRYRAKYGAQFKIDVTPANTLEPSQSRTSRSLPSPRASKSREDPSRYASFRQRRCT